MSTTAAQCFLARFGGAAEPRPPSLGQCHGLLLPQGSNASRHHVSINLATLPTNLLPCPVGYPHGAHAPLLTWPFKFSLFLTLRPPKLPGCGPEQPAEMAG